jgi:hypothetical protein
VCVCVCVCELLRPAVVVTLLFTVVALLSGCFHTDVKLLGYYAEFILLLRCCNTVVTLL